MIELCGSEGSGKSELLLNVTAQCVLPRKNNGVLIGMSVYVCLYIYIYVHTMYVCMYAYVYCIHAIIFASVLASHFKFILLSQNENK